MANLKEVRNRINSVKSTQQITKAMKMVAAAKLRRAQDKIIQMRPYAKKLDAILKNVSSSLDASVQSPYAQPREEVKKVLLILVTSDKGLCGGFNANVSKAAMSLLNNKYKAQFEKGDYELLCIGKKANDFFKRREYNLNSDYVGLFTDLNFKKVKECAEFVMDSFLKGKYDQVEIVYNEFKNVATQVVVNEQFLPVAEIEDQGSEEEIQSTEYIFEPDSAYILQELIPKTIKIQLFKAVLESNASEHGARMTAMDKATDNAGELLKELKLTYNRTRQAAITTEILEIVSGAEALEQG